jgi:hypothetical protein
MAHAYSSAPPKAAQTRIDALVNSSDEGFFEQKVFEVDPAQPSSRYAIRLGNRFYPHMKLIIEPTPTGSGHLFRADTHDQHIRPQPGTRDAELFSQLVVQNQSIGEAIESAWENAGLPTFKSYLRQDLARRVVANRSSVQDIETPKA